MTSKAEKLAWELIRVLAKYKPREIEEAIVLVEGGKLFEKSTKLLGQLSKVREKPVASRHAHSRAPLIDDHFSLGEAPFDTPRPLEPSQITEASQVLAAPQASGHSDTTGTSDRTIDARNNFNSLSPSDQASIRDLAEGMSTGSYLKTSSLLRDYASRLNIDLPKKLPSRSVLTLRIIEEVLLLDGDQMKHFIEAAKSMSGDVSSLQEWSNLIVRRN